MRRLLAIFAGLLAFILPFLALSAPTAWLILVGHLLLTGLVSVGSCLEGLAGWPERARLWGFAYLVATGVMLGALEAAAHARGAGPTYWAVPWVCALSWGWVPPLLAGLAGLFGEGRQDALTRRHRRLRRRG